MGTVTLTDERRAIIEVLEQAEGPLGPKDVADQVESPAPSVRSLLPRMVEAGQIQKVSRGLYAPLRSATESIALDDSSTREIDELRRLPDDQLKQMGLFRVYQLSVEAGAGPGTEVHFEEVNGGEVLPGWFIRQEYGIEPWRLKEITVRGNSMEPTIHAGERIRVAIFDGEEVLAGAVYVVWGPEGLMVKRIDFDVERDGPHEVARYVWIKSDNPEAHSYCVPLEVFRRDYHVQAFAVELKRKL